MWSRCPAALLIPRKSRSSPRSQASAGKASPKADRRWRPGSIRLLEKTRLSTSSISSPARRDVYEGFEAAIRERETKGETVESRFVAIDKSDIAGVELRGRTAQITVRFVSQLISVTRDKSGNVIDGNPDKVTDVTDVWTFARDLSSRDPNWKLVATEAGQ